VDYTMPPKPAPANFTLPPNWAAGLPPGVTPPPALRGGGQLPPGFLDSLKFNVDEVKTKFQALGARKDVKFNDKDHQYLFQFPAGMKPPPVSSGYRTWMGKCTESEKTVVGTCIENKKNNFRLSTFALAAKLLEDGDDELAKEADIQDFWCTSIQQFVSNAGSCVELCLDEDGDYGGRNHLKGDICNALAQGTRTGGLDEKDPGAADNAALPGRPGNLTAWQVKKGMLLADILTSYGCATDWVCNSTIDASIQVALDSLTGQTVELSKSNGFALGAGLTALISAVASILALSI